MIFTQKTYIPSIAGFSDFCQQHMRGEPIFLVNGKLYAGFDLLVDIKYRYHFTEHDSKQKIEQAIQQNMYLFDVRKSNRFFYPNTNMFSGDCSEYGIEGQVLVIKEKYRRQWA